MKPKYIYDINIGHFIKVINEDDNNIQNQENSEESNQDTSTAQSNFKSVESNEDIQQINSKITAENDKYSKDSNTQQQLLDQAKRNASNKQLNDKSGIYDPVATDSNVLSIQKKLNDLTKQHYMTLCQLEEQKVQILSKVSAAN